ncbi:MAG: hypothetical protein J2P36_38915, partial [Ktedonobacteraceae bacterium]|nr:hypothetical protein [Ktedonobacteraceae bacterium]
MCKNAAPLCIPSTNAASAADFVQVLGKEVPGTAAPQADPKRHRPVTNPAQLYTPLVFRPSTTLARLASPRLSAKNLPRLVQSYETYSGRRQKARRATSRAPPGLSQP